MTNITQKFKIIAAMFILSFALLAVQPNISTASRLDIASAPPAITFVQKKDTKMLIDHDFNSDNSIYVTVEDESVDTGFYVQIK